MEAEQPEKIPFTTPFLEKKRNDLLNLQKSVEDMRKDLEAKRAARLKQRAREDICFWMDNAVIPFLEGISDGFNEPLLLGVQRLIREKKNPFRPKQDWDRSKDTETALMHFFANPQTKVLQTLVKPYIKAKMDWINLQAEWIREEIVKEEYPMLYEAIMQTEGGKEWLDELIADFVKTIRKLTR